VQPDECGSERRAERITATRLPYQFGKWASSKGLDRPHSREAHTLTAEIIVHTPLQQSAGGQQ